MLLLALVPAASERAASTIGQLAGVTLLLAVLAPLAARRALSRTRSIEPGEQLTGEPTALWKPPLVMLVLATPFVVAGELGVTGAGWDAGLRVTGGCLLVGLAQALVVERLVARDEAARPGAHTCAFQARARVAARHWGSFVTNACRSVTR